MTSAAALPAPPPSPAAAAPSARHPSRLAIAAVEATLWLDLLDLPAHLLAVSAEGAELMLAPAQAARMKRAILEDRPRSLALSLALPWAGAHVRTPAGTRQVSWGPDGTRIGLRFRLPRARLLAADPALRTLFNQRSVVRVPIDPANPLPVRVEGPAGEPLVDGVPACDISLGGVGLRLPPHLDALLPAGREVRLTLGLRPTPLVLRATVRHAEGPRGVRPAGAPGATVHVGFAFHPADTAHPRAADRLANEVMRRQLDARKAAAPR